MRALREAAAEREHRSGLDDHFRGRARSAKVGRRQRRAAHPRARRNARAQRSGRRRCAGRCEGALSVRAAAREPDRTAGTVDALAAARPTEARACTYSA
jgi:hypothetical protein